jgi:hypothetical protein
MSYVCSVCGAEHDGLPALTFKSPDYWHALDEENRANGRCDSDVCVTRTPEEHFFVRCALVLPIKNGPERTLEFGVWSTLSRDNFMRYAETFNDADQSKLGPMFGWLSNEIAGDFAGAANLKCHIHPQDDRQRPIVELEPTNHPLALAQRDGITFEYAQHLVHRHGAV